MLFRSGTGDLTIETEVFRYHDNMFTIIPKNIPHDTFSDGQVENRWEYLFIDVEHIINDAFGFNPLLAQELIHGINSKASLINVEEELSIATIIRNIFEVMREQKPYANESAKHMLVALLLQIARKNQDIGQAYQKLESDCSSVAMALDYITDYFYEPLKIEELAELSHMSEPHFRRVFKENMNMTPMDYINMVRIQMACEYMKKEHVSMEIIGEKVGYSTPSTFNRNFKKFLGISPYQWKLHPESYEGKLQNFKISALKGW